MADDVPLTFAAYQEAAATSDRDPAGSLVIPLLGLFGETGGLLSVVKKKKRDRETDIEYRRAVIEELGDVLWYLTTVARHAGITLSDIASNANPGFANWVVGGSKDLPFSEVQNGSPMVVPLEPTSSLEGLLLEMAGEVGSVLADYHAGRLTDNQAALAGRLVAVFRTLLKAGNEAGVSLEEAAQFNLKKIFDRWPRKKIYPVF